MKSLNLLKSSISVRLSHTNNLIEITVFQRIEPFSLDISPEGPQKTKAPSVTTAPVTTAIKIRSFSMFYGVCTSIKFHGTI